MVGNPHGVAAAGIGSTLLATVTADGANTVTVDSIENLQVGMKVDITHRTTGAVLASNRTITGITSAGVVTYDGADAAATTDHGLYQTGQFAAGRSNVNGGNTPGAGYSDPTLLSIDAMRERLAAIDAGYYTAARLNNMTMNDMVYAIRRNDDSATIKQ